MRLWTIQSPSRLEDLDKSGVIYGTWDRIKAEEDGYYYEPYKWLVGQMKDRMPEHSGKAPIWAWPVKPDLRWYRWHWSPGWHVCIEFEAPDDLVLQSDYDMWHNVLSDFPVNLSEAEWDDFCDRDDAKAYTEAEKHASWQRIFDASLPPDPWWCGKEGTPRVWQACVDGVRKDWLKGVRVFETLDLGW